MARYIGPKIRFCRHFGEHINAKGDKCSTVKCGLVRRSYPPGQHGQQSKLRLSAFAKQLQEKQKARRIYGLLERQFRTYYKKAIKDRGNTGDRLLQYCELRLDNVVYRLGLASSRNFARQLIRHGHITVNERMISVPSYQLKSNDKIGINTARRAQPYWQETIKRLSKNDRLPKWLSLDSVEISGRIERLPAHDDLNIGLETPLIVEYYSR